MTGTTVYGYPTNFPQATIPIHPPMYCDDLAQWHRRNADYLAVVDRFFNAIGDIHGFEDIHERVSIRKQWNGNDDTAMQYTDDAGVTHSWGHKHSYCSMHELRAMDQTVLATLWVVAAPLPGKPGEPHSYLDRPIIVQMGDDRIELDTNLWEWCHREQPDSSKVSKAGRLLNHSQLRIALMLEEHCLNHPNS